MKSRFFILLNFLLILTTWGCSIYHVNSEDIATDFYPPKSSPYDVAFSEEINRPHEVIAYITVNTERRQHIDDIIHKMKREAAIIGADAITNIRTDATGRWKRLPAQGLISNAYVRANFTAEAVVFK